MASVRHQLSAKMTAFLYDHQTVSRQGEKFKKSYRDVEKKIQSIGHSTDRKKT